MTRDTPRPGGHFGRPVRRVGLRFDATARIGVGHGMRMLALAEELHSRGIEVLALGEVSVPWLAALLQDAGVALRPAPASTGELAGTARSLDLDAVTLDRYDLDPSTGTELRAAGIGVLAMSDAQFGAAQEADIHLDQNFGAVNTFMRRDGGRQLTGPDYWLTRDAVRRHRGRRPRPGGGPPAMLAVFGGTDPFHAAEAIVPLVLATGAPVDLRVVTPHRRTADLIRSLPLQQGQSVDIIGATPDLPALAAQCDVAVSAAGSTVWELLCIGVPTALVAVAENQELGYTMTVDAGLSVGAGRLTQLDRPQERRQATENLRNLLTDGQLRSELTERGRTLFDGDGRARVVDALLQLPTSLD